MTVAQLFGIIIAIFIFANGIIAMNKFGLPLTFWNNSNTSDEEDYYYIVSLSLLTAEMIIIMALFIPWDYKLF